MIEDVLEKYGYTKSQIETLKNKYLVKKTNQDTLEKIVKDKIYFLEKIGYKLNEIIKMTVLFPSIFTYSNDYIVDKIKYLIEKGYTKEEIIKMTKIVPAIYGYKKESIDKKIELLETIGFSKKEILKMTVRTPAIYGYNNQNIIDKIEDLKQIGYTKEQILKMMKDFPGIFSHNIAFINEKINKFIEFGFSKKDTLNITSQLPSLLGLSFENTKEKIIFLRKIGLENVITSYPKKLMQSIELMYARYNYLTKMKNISINEATYKYIFYDDKRFVIQFGIDKKSILELFPYQEEKSKTKKRNNV